MPREHHSRGIPIINTISVLYFVSQMQHKGTIRERPQQILRKNETDLKICGKQLYGKDHDRRYRK